MWSQDLVTGLLASLVPIYLMSKVCQEKELKCPNVGQIILLFTVSNIILLPLFRFVGITSPIFTGVILGIVYSSIGRFIGRVPQTVFEMNPNLFQVYAVILWPIVYLFIDYLI